MSDQPTLFPMPQEVRTSDDYWTPQWIFDAMGIQFDLDVACPPEGPAHTPAAAWYTQETDGLTSPWHGRVWMNPPFSNSAPWVRKFMNHRSGVALVPASKSSWCDELWIEADGIVLLPAKMKFDQGSIFIATILVAFNDECVEAISRVGKVR